MTLETELRDLALHLDAPSGDGISAAVRRVLVAGDTAAPASSSRRRARWVPVLAAAAVVVVLAVAGTVALTDPFGRDHTEAGPRPVPTTPRETVPGPSAPAPAVETMDLANARAAVEIPVRVPAGIDVAPRITVDRRAPGGLVALEYPTFAVVAVAAPAGAAAGEVAGLGPESQVRPVAVRGQPGLWITGTHREIAYLDRDGALRQGPTRTSGHVLMWVEDGVTYRVEGFEQQITAMQVATSLQ